MAATIDRVRAVTLPILEDLGVDLYDLEVAGGVVRITIDRSGGVDLETITRVTRLVSRELEHRADPAAELGMEVSSPGLERNLRTPDHFRRARGMTASVKLGAHVQGERRVQGVVGSSDDDGVMIGTIRVAYSDIDKARTVFEWGPKPKPGKGPKKTPPATPATDDDTDGDEFDELDDDILDDDDIFDDDVDDDDDDESFDDHDTDHDDDEEQS